MIALKRVELTGVVSRPESVGTKTGQFAAESNGRRYQLDYDPEHQLVRVVCLSAKGDDLYIPTSAVRAMYVDPAPVDAEKPKAKGAKS